MTDVDIKDNVASGRSQRIKNCPTSLGKVHLPQKIASIEGDDILKSEQAFVVQLSEVAIDLNRRQKGKHIRRANTGSFKKACLKVGIEHLRWHDLRHTWATWHVQRGTPLEVLQELGGWSDYKMVKRYAHFTHQHQQQYINNSPKAFFYNTPYNDKFQAKN